MTLDRQEDLPGRDTREPEYSEEPDESDDDGERLREQEARAKQRTKDLLEIVRP